MRAKKEVETLPVVVIEMRKGVVTAFNATTPVKILFIEEDVACLDAADIKRLGGIDVYATAAVVGRGRRADAPVRAEFCIETCKALGL